MNSGSPSGTVVVVVGAMVVEVVGGAVVDVVTGGAVVDVVGGNVVVVGWWHEHASAECFGTMSFWRSWQSPQADGSTVPCPNPSVWQSVQLAASCAEMSCGNWLPPEL